MTRAGLATTSLLRESKGQSWLVSRHSSTSLQNIQSDDDDEDSLSRMAGSHHRLHFADDEFSPETPRATSRWGSRFGSRAASARNSRRGSRSDLHSSALDYFDTYRQERLPANLIQGQRDFFGAHTYKRLDKPGTFHTVWTPEGTPETVASTPSTRRPWAGGEGEGDRAPRPGDLPPGSDEDRALEPANRDLQRAGGEDA